MATKRRSTSLGFRATSSSRPTRSNSHFAGDDARRAAVVEAHAQGAVVLQILGDAFEAIAPRGHLHAPSEEARVLLPRGHHGHGAVGDEAIEPMLETRAQQCREV